MQTILSYAPILLLLCPILAAVLICLSNKSVWQNGIMYFVPLIAIFISYNVLIQIEHLADAAPILLFTPFPTGDIALSIDVIGSIFLVLVSVLWFLSMIYTIGYIESVKLPRRKNFLCFFSLAIAATIGVACSDNLITLFLFYELLTLVTYPLVSHNASASAKKGGKIYLYYLLVSSLLFFLPALMLVWHQTGSFAFVSGGLLAQHQVDPTLLLLMFLLFVFGIAKTAVFPLHRWLPAAMVAPAPVSGLLHAVAVVKTGVFSLLKVALYIFGLDTMRALNLDSWLIGISSVTIILASFWAIRERDLKKCLAFSTIGQLSYIVLGIAIATPISIIAAVLHMVMHAFAKITLFFLSGIFAIGFGVKTIDRMHVIPPNRRWLLLLFIIASLSIVGLPLFGGMWSKFYLVQAAIATERNFLLVILFISSMMSVLYLLAEPTRVLFNPKNTQSMAIQQKKIASGCLVATITTAVVPIILFVLADPIFKKLILFFHIP